jgi:hypothetical protein
LKSDQAAQRVTDDVGRGDPLGVEDCQRVIGHLSNGYLRPDRLAAAHPPVVEPQAGVIGREFVRLWPPAGTLYTHALDE